jgi:hypothetical protein
MQSTESDDKEEDFLDLDYFASGVPALLSFVGALEDITTILRLVPSGESSSFTQRRLYELCFVGAVSYFESFCKDHFASILNIAPQLVSKLSQAGIETRIDPMLILEARGSLSIQIGFLVTERMDMGTADRINKLYGHILKITPFSKENCARFADILRDRNLFVHHGGIYTHGYLKQTVLSRLSSDTSKAFVDSKNLTEEDVIDLVEFLREISVTTAKSSKSALHSLVNELGGLRPSAKKAIDYLDYIID